MNVKRLKYLVTLALLLILGVMVYYHYANKSKESDAQEDIDQITKILEMDLENNYPKTAREVVAYFVKIQKCYYNEEPDDEQLLKLSAKAQELFDKELLENNSFDGYFGRLDDEVKKYSSEGKTIKKTILDKASDIIYSDVAGVKYAQMDCKYYFNPADNNPSFGETYILRCDSEGKWKILGWKLSTTSEYEE